MKTLVRGLILLAGVVLIVAYASGALSGERIRPGKLPPPEGLPAPPRTATAQRTKVPVLEEATGAIQSRTRIAVAAQVTARIVRLVPRAGDTVTAGELLVTLDSRALEARLGQAHQAAKAAKAARDAARQARDRAEARLNQATTQRERVSALFGKGAATKEELDQADADFRAAKAATAEAAAAIAGAEAQIAQSKDALQEAGVALTHTKIVSPIDGVVQSRPAEQGDLAQPGKPLLVLLDPKALRLEADVREGLIHRVHVKETLQITVPAAAATLTGTVTEILPAADPMSRTFPVHVDFTAQKGVRPGMFGRLRLEVGTREIVEVPQAAVTKVGQIETVLVKNEGRWERWLVTTGKTLPENKVEVLSGLRGAETIGLPAETGK